MKDKILKKILKKLNDPDLADKLINRLSFSELQSLLMIVYDEKRKSIRTRDILDQYKNDPFPAPSGIEQHIQNTFDSVIYSALGKDYVSVELSPVSPLGCCSQVAGISQDKVFSTTRKNEVCSDPTNMLALEASLCRRSSNETIRLATSHRVLRTERFISVDSVPHFRVFSLCIAGRDEGNFRFEREKLHELIFLYLKMFRELYSNGYHYSKIRVAVKCIDQEVLNALDISSFKNTDNKETEIEFSVDKNENWAYYTNIRFQIFLSDTEAEYFIVDGGFTDWTQKLLGNKKERFLISGLGSERFMMLFSIRKAGETT